jgi:predicted nucleic-acid-binding Zn-ribbon protein
MTDEIKDKLIDIYNNTCIGMSCSDCPLNTGEDYQCDTVEHINFRIEVMLEKDMNSAIEHAFYSPF